MAGSEATKFPASQEALDTLFQAPKTQLELARWLHPGDLVAQLELFKESVGKGAI